jgi:pantothenate kinase-related protein Tda10
MESITALQKTIMLHIQEWARKQKKPIMQRDIVSFMSTQGTGRLSTISALDRLLQKGYIRRAVTISNTTSYVMIRSVYQ